MKHASFLALSIAAVLLGCGGAEKPVETAKPTPSAKAPATSAALDSMGPRPSVAEPAAFVPPVPTVFKAKNGITVWLLERHNLPIASFALSMPTGSASDPAGKGGLARATANMLDEGAGTRSAIELSGAIETLGASLHTSSDADASYVLLTTLKKNLGDAFAIFSDVVARPRFEEKEWKRVHDLWENDLKQRTKDPDATARVIFRTALFGEGHPYAHPWDGTVESAKLVQLTDVKSFYKSNWRADRATLVAVGDITRPEMETLIDNGFKSWTPPKDAAPAVVVPKAPTGPWPRLVVVDRKDAPQSIIAAIRPGVSVTDPAWPVLARANIAIGGSFTSRLNQDLREEKGYSYGARTRISATRGVGQIAAYAAVHTEKTGDAMKAMLADLSLFAEKGMTDEEVSKTHSQARAEVVQMFESVGAIAGHLADHAGLGLAPDADVTLNALRDSATAPVLNDLARRYYDPKNAILVIVGPYAQIKAQLDGLGLPPPEMRDPSGRILAAPAAPSKGAAKDRERPR